MNPLLFREPVSAWTHFLWFLLAVPGALLLCWKSRRDRPKQLALSVYGLSLAGCYAASALCHGVRLPPEQVAVFVLLDHIGIYLLIAGTCTPIVFTLLRGPWRWGILLSAWLVAGVGVALNLVYGTLPPGLFTGFYLGMGWGFALCYLELARVVSHRVLRPVVAGGAFYSLGAVFNLLGWPVLWPGVFQAHEVLHVFAMAGSLVHYFFMYDVVVPFDRPRGRVERRQAQPEQVEESLGCPSAAVEAV
jgi:hemolysin III